jgi:hypothetical protein
MNDTDFTEEQLEALKSQLDPAVLQPNPNGKLEYLLQQERIKCENEFYSQNWIKVDEAYLLFTAIMAYLGVVGAYTIFRWLLREHIKPAYIEVVDTIKWVIKKIKERK